MINNIEKTQIWQCAIPELFYEKTQSPSLTYLTSL